MDINLVPFERLKELKKEVIKKLGENEVKINYFKQTRFKFNKITQSNKIILNDRKKDLTKIKDRIDEKIKQGR